MKHTGKERLLFSLLCNSSLSCLNEGSREDFQSFLWWLQRGKIGGGFEQTGTSPRKPISDFTQFFCQLRRLQEGVGVGREPRAEECALEKAEPRQARTHQKQSPKPASTRASDTPRGLTSYPQDNKSKHWAGARSGGRSAARPGPNLVLSELWAGL